MSCKLTSLQTFLEVNELPLIPDRPATFLSIAGRANHELAWSNIYSFFFNLEAEHNLKDLFINTLLELINHHRPEFKFNLPYRVKTEVATIKKGRIDILLCGDTDAIIIENKVFHYLANDLNDYWDSVKVSNKIGVILCLHSNQTVNENFVTITHKDFLGTILNRLDRYVEDQCNKYLIFIKDFYQNAVNTTNLMDQNTIDFYQKNIFQINQLHTIRNNYIKHVSTAIENAVAEIEERLVPGSSRNEKFRYYRCPEDGNLLFTVYFERFISKGDPLLFIVELQGELLKNKDKIKEIPFTDEESLLLKKEFYDDRSSSWAHFAVQSCLPDSNELLSLEQYISCKINQSPLLDIYRKLRAVLVTSRKNL
ncbi:PD-(D/E)XK nuclease family protein [Flavobacterium rakeshii]|uniref:PD-(D/E)XK nuclease family protein n=1 Tax=Flavobacterium rakeshii TaxID=1038845 RepID=UPI002E7BFD2F|nr:PD-(D/E)XK nuclease family protein [Flavobacterium rakeshii]MEE1896993.1 PD-(D/E)XK nuclease family protein [Flavobacterium rakeshii]